MAELRDTAQNFDHVPDISLARTSARQARVNGESRAKGRTGVMLLAFDLPCLHLPEKDKKNSFVTNFRRPNAVF